MKTRSLSQLKEEITLLMRYAVPTEHLETATILMEKHETDAVALSVFHHFYSFLPEGEDDWIKIIRLLDRRQGTFLLCVGTAITDYLYLATTERAEFLGPLGEGPWDEEVLSFFGYADRQAFLQKYKDISSFPVYVPAHLDAKLCPGCLVSDGEIHTFGCPVEVCPWCQGQLTGCQCRFTQTGREELDRESQIDAFLEILNEKGRIPFTAEQQRPTYPSVEKLLGD